MGKNIRFASLLIAWLLISLPAYAKQTEYVLAPVYFVTDRVPVKQNGRIQFRDYGQKIDSFSAGIKYVPVPMRDDIQKTWSELEAKGWIDKAHFPSVAEKKKKSDSKSEALEAAEKLSNYELSDEEITRTLKKLPDNTEIVLYVHGFFNSFNDGTESAAELTSFFKTPVIVYCWTTPKDEVRPNPVPTPLIKLPNLTPKIWQSYRESEVTHQHGQERFTALLVSLDMNFPGRLIPVAHSMGSRLLDQALLCRYGYFELAPKEKRLKEVIFSNPDLDGRYFATHAERLCDQAERVRVFFVAQDGAMKVSKFLHGNHDRLGAPNPSISALIKRSDVSMIDMSKLGKGNLGTLGHTMPSWVLSNMHKYGTIDKEGRSYVERRPNNDDKLIILEPVKGNTK